MGITALTPLQGRDIWQKYDLRRHSFHDRCRFSLHGAFHELCEPNLIARTDQDGVSLPPPHSRPLHIAQPTLMIVVVGCADVLKHCDTRNAVHSVQSICELAYSVVLTKCRRR